MAEEESTAPPTSVVPEPESSIDGFFIGGMVCVGLGVIFVIVAIVYLIMWCCRARKEKSQEKRRRRHLEHMRHLEEYSIKAGDSPNGAVAHNNNPPTPGGDSVFKWESSDLVNMGYVSEDTLERLSHNDPAPKLSAHINGSTSSYGQQRSRSQAGSMSSRQNSMTSVNDVTVAPGGSAQNDNDNRRSDNNGVPVRSRSDRLADVPM